MYNDTKTKNVNNLLEYPNDFLLVISYHGINTPSFIEKMTFMHWYSTCKFLNNKYSLQDKAQFFEDKARYIEKKFNTMPFYKDRLLYIELYEKQYMYNMASLIENDLHSICVQFSEWDKKILGLYDPRKQYITFKNPIKYYIGSLIWSEYTHKLLNKTCLLIELMYEWKICIININGYAIGKSICYNKEFIENHTFKIYHD